MGRQNVSSSAEEAHRWCTHRVPREAACLIASASQPQEGLDFFILRALRCRESSIISLRARRRPWEGAYFMASASRPREATHSYVCASHAAIRSIFHSQAGVAGRGKGPISLRVRVGRRKQPNSCSRAHHCRGKRHYFVASASQAAGSSLIHRVIVVMIVFCSRAHRATARSSIISLRAQQVAEAADFNA